MHAAHSADGAARATDRSHHSAAVPPCRLTPGLVLHLCRGLVFAVVVGWLWGLVASPASAEDLGALEALRFRTPPTIDGVLDEWDLLEDANTGRVDRRDQALPARRDAWDGPDDLSARFRLGVDDGWLYFAASVRDEAIFHPRTPWWHGDSIELFLDTDRSPGGEPATRYGPGCWQIFLMPANAELAWGVAFQGTHQVFGHAGLTGVRIGYRRHGSGEAGGYDIEAAIPLAGLGLSGHDARTLGFALALNDADTGSADPGTYLSWNGRFDLYRRPDYFGALRLPRHDPPPPPPIDGGGNVLWIVIAVLIALASVLLLAGPGAKAFARWGPRPKLVALALTGLLAVIFSIDAQRTTGRLEAEVREDLETLAEEAQDIAAQAEAVGALPRDDPHDRARVLAELLRGGRVACALPPEAVACVDVGRTGTGGWQLPLDAGLRLHLTPPAMTEYVALHLEVDARPSRDGEFGETIPLVSLIAEGPTGSSEPITVEVDPSQASVQRVLVPLDGVGPWERLRLQPATGAPAALLSAVEAAEAGGEAGEILALAPDTDDGIPILGGPGAPPFERALEVDGTLDVPLPYLLGADRLWLVLTATDAFPITLENEPIARVEVAYDRGPAADLVVRNGEHVVAESLPPGIRRPPDMRSRIAYRWTDVRGQEHTHDAMALPLDPARRALSMRVENTGGAGRLRIFAATVVRSTTLPRDSRLGVGPGPGGIDEVFVLHPAPAFAHRLGEGGGNSVRLSRSVGSGAVTTPLSLTAPLPAEVGAKQARTEIALATCLAIALVLLAFLGVDLVERFHRLTMRLAVAVLVAALLPLGVTLWLMDRTTHDRLEVEHAARARSALSAAEGALQDALRRTKEDAHDLARHLVREAQGAEPSRADRLVRLYRGGALPTGAASLAIVSAAERPTYEVRGDGPAASLLGAAWVARRWNEPGLHISPWDGLLLVGSARRGRGDRWVRVTLAVRVDDAFLASELGGVLPSADAALALLDAGGTPLASAGEGGNDFVEALAGRRADLDRLPPGGALERVDPRSSAGRPRLAVAARLGTVDADAAAPWLAVGLDRTSIEQALRDQRERLAWLALFGVVLVAGVATLTARRVADPIKGLVRVTEAVRRGEFDVEVPPAGVDEVGDLTLAFDQMRHDLKHRVADLDFVRSAQEALAGSLDLERRASTVLDLFGRCFAPDAMLLIDATTPSGPLTVVAERGRQTTFGERSFHGAGGGWLQAALGETTPLEVDAPGSDERVAAEGGLGARLVEDRPAWLAVPLHTGGDLTGLVVLAYDEPARVPRGEARRLLAPLAGACALALHNARLYRLAALDDVTRLPGTTAFEAALRADVERAVSGAGKTTLLRIGLDHLEHVALRRGVELARDLLRACALALRETVGDLSRLGRLREDELAVRLGDIPHADALVLAEQIRERLGRIEVVPEEGGDAVGSTATIGVAHAPDDATSLEFLLDAAGRALAAARREGGDRVADAARLDVGLVDMPPYEEGTIVRSEKMVRVVEAARRAARTDSSVLLTGETGTGKEVIASLVHRRSARAERPFVTVNCAAFPETLLESELFGHERGAFTGAERRREGRFELADGGTLFLDEIAEMSLTAQVKLLRVLQERQFTRLGGTRTVNVDVRIVAATNRDLESEVAEGSFREDLYYRLNVIRLELPPLRERREEIPPLVEAFLVDAARRAGRGPSRLTSAAMDVLYRHPWPGNVRELKNVVERCVVMCDAAEAGPEHLQLDGSRPSGAPAPRAAPRDDLNDRQKRVLDHLARHGRCTNREYQELTGTSPRTGLRDLQDLMERGLVIREGKRRGAVYRLP